jgi:hypothetical protein
MKDHTGISQWFVKFLSRNGCRKNNRMVVIKVNDTLLIERKQKI